MYAAIDLTRLFTMSLTFFFFLNEIGLNSFILFLFFILFFLQVTRYEFGGTYEPHYDAMVSGRFIIPQIKENHHTWILQGK